MSSAFDRFPLLMRAAQHPMVRERVRLVPATAFLEFVIEEKRAAKRAARRVRMARKRRRGWA